MPPETGPVLLVGAGSLGIAALSLPPDQIPPAVTVPGPDVTNTIPVNAVPGLPGLGSIPMILLLGGLLLAAGVGWYISTAGNILFGAGAGCAHGLKAGIPDLRKV